MKNALIPLRILTLASVLLAASSAHAILVFTIENPGVQASTVPGVITETFNSYPLGAFAGSSLVGTFSAGGAVHVPDAYGGSFATDYYAVGGQSGHLSSTLTFSGPRYYFGMYWPAGDAGNQLDFYNGATLLASYRVGNIIPSLSSAYYGNPNNGLDSGEPFVYLDFTAVGGDVITSVQFQNDSLGSGFEMDNLSVYDQPITPPGNGVPDGGSSLLMLGGAMAALLSARCKCKS